MRAQKESVDINTNKRVNPNVALQQAASDGRTDIIKLLIASNPKSTKMPWRFIVNDGSRIYALKSALAQLLVHRGKAESEKVVAPAFTAGKEMVDAHKKYMGARSCTESRSGNRCPPCA